MDLLIPGLGLILWTLLSLGSILLILLAVVNLTKNPNLTSNTKVLWILLIISLPLFGAIAYFINRKNSK